MLACVVDTRILDLMRNLPGDNLDHNRLNSLNHDYLYQELNGYKGLKMIPLEATYLAWIDAKGTGIDNIQEQILKSGVRVMDGKTFMGDGFFRLNFACPKSVLMEAVERIKSVF